MFIILYDVQRHWGRAYKKETDDSVSFYINGKSDYLMFGFSLFHSATGGRTPIAITSSRSAHKCS